MKKINLKKWSIIFAIILVAIFSINNILSSVVSKLVNAQLIEINKQGKNKIAVGNIKLNVFTGSLTLKNVEVKRDSLFFEKFKQGISEKASTSEFTLSDLKIRGFSIYDILVKKKIHANKIIAKGMVMNLFKSELLANKEKKATDTSNKTDSIFIKGINEIDFNSIIFDDFELKVINVQSYDTLFSYKEKECKITGIDFKAHTEIENYFVLNKEGLKIDFEEQEIETKKGDYKIVLNNIKYNYKTSSLLISKFIMNPTIEKEKLASTYSFNSEVYALNIDAIQLKGFHLDSILRTGVIKLDTVLIERPIIGIYKDQTKPFNTNKRPKFLNQTLKKLEQPLSIDKVIVTNGLFNYWEKHEGFKELMMVDITDLNIKVSNITSIKENYTPKEKLKINLKGNICKVAPLNLDIFMNYTTWNNSYSFTGSIGSANFIDFNGAVYPGTGVNFSRGNLDSMQFTVQGTPSGSSGKMTMLYHDLEADFATKEKEKKGLTWITNTVLHSSNPSNKGKLRVAEIEFERVLYKGFGNLLWKSVQSGMVNTLLPIGKNEKIDQTVSAEKHSKKKHKKNKH